MEALTAKESDIVTGLRNVEDVIDELLVSKIITMDIYEKVFDNKKTNSEKNKTLMEELRYVGTKAIRGLYDALYDTENVELAQLLSPYVLEIEREANLLNPAEWPPNLSEEEQLKMEKDPVKLIKDVKHPSFIHLYKAKDVYKMRNKVRGNAYIINNFKFSSYSKLSYRTGSERDVTNLEQLFTDLLFKVICRGNLTARGMIEFLETERDKVDIWDNIECVILVISSHGQTTGICGEDGHIAPLNRLTEIFDSIKCPGMKGKPRLVFVQACRTPGGSDVKASDKVGETEDDGQHKVEERNQQSEYQSESVEEDTSIKKLGLNNANSVLDAAPVKAMQMVPKAAPQSPDYPIACTEENTYESQTSDDKARYGADLVESAGQHRIEKENQRSENLSDNIAEDIKMFDLNFADDVLNAAPDKAIQMLPKNVHPAADYLIAYSTPEGSNAFRHIEVGSWFLNAVVWTFKYHAHDTSIDDLMTKVNELVTMATTSNEDVQVSQRNSFLKKKFYFFPGICGDPPRIVDEND